MSLLSWPTKALAALSLGLALLSLFLWLQLKAVKPGPAPVASTKKEEVDRRVDRTTTITRQKDGSSITTIVEKEREERRTQESKTPRPASSYSIGLHTTLPVDQGVEGLNSRRYGVTLGVRTLGPVWLEAGAEVGQNNKSPTVQLGIRTEI